MPNITVIEKVTDPPSPSEKTVETYDDRLSRLTFESIDSAAVLDDDMSIEEYAPNDSGGFVPPKLSRDASMLTRVFEDSSLDQEKQRRDEDRLKILEDQRRLFGDDDTNSIDRERLAQQKREMKRSSQSNALAFVRQEERRVNAMNWLFERGHEAVIKCNRDESYQFLVEKTLAAKAKTSHITKSLRSSASSFSHTKDGRRQSILKRSDLSRATINSHKKTGMTGVPETLLSSRESARRSARQSAGMYLPPNEITNKRNDLLAKRRQSIIDNKMQRAQFSVPVDVGAATPGVDNATGSGQMKRSRILSMMSFDEDDEMSQSSGSSGKINSSPKAVSPQQATSPSMSAGRVDKRRRTPRTKTAESTPPFAWAREFESEYFRGKSTDPGFFPPTALESAAYLVAALHGKSDLVLNGNTYKRDAKTPAVDTLIQAPEMNTINAKPDAYVHPINHEILLNMQNKLNQNKKAARQATKKQYFRSSSEGTVIYLYILTYIYIEVTLLILTPSTW